jgi:hypothetical protein
MTTIPTLNAPTFTPSQKVDFGTLGDLANTYRTSQQQQTKMQQDAATNDLAQRAYAQYLGLPDPGPSNSTSSGGGWLSNLKSYIGMGGGAPSPPQGLAPPSMIPAGNVVTPTMTPALPQASVPLPMARPQIG